MLLSSEPWGRINHDGSACMCLSSDGTGAYIHGLSINPADMETRDDLLSVNNMVRPGSIPYVSHQAGAHVKLLVATYERMIAGSLSACGRSHGERGEWLLQSMRGGGAG